MINGLAIWHYPHRTLLENINFFAEQGFKSVSALGTHFYSACQDNKTSCKMASLVKEKNILLTVHAKMPSTHSEDDVKEFENFIDCIADWQKKYGLLAVLSFDVPQHIRDNVMPYIEYVLKYEEFKKVAVEDFGLTKEEKEQIEHLKENKRFGFLVDIGHMYIRMRGKNTRGVTIFENQESECKQTDNPGYDDFLRAIETKGFPIFEIHLHNNDGIDDLHYFFDDGTLDIGMISDVLKDLKYEEILTIESAPGFKFECRYPESDERILKTFEYWKNVSSLG